jgi:hypothetical protein
LKCRLITRRLKVGEILSGHSNREFVLETPRPVDVQAIVARLATTVARIESLSARF